MQRYEIEELEQQINGALRSAWSALNYKEDVPVVYHLLKALEELKNMRE